MKRAMLDKSIEKTTALSAAFAAAAQQQSAAAAMASALRGAVNGMMSLPIGGQLGQFPMSVSAGVGNGGSANAPVFPLCAAANYYGGAAAAGLAGMSPSAAGAAAAAANGVPSSYWYGNLASNFASSLTGAGTGVNAGGQSAPAASGGQPQSYSSQTYPSVYVPCARLYSNNNNSGTGSASPQAKLATGEKLAGGDTSDKVLSPPYEKRFVSPFGASSYKPSEALSSAAAAAGVFDLTGAASGGGSYAESYMAAFQSNLLHANSAAAAAAANIGSIGAGLEGASGMWPGAPATAIGLHVGAGPQAESLLGAVGTSFPFGAGAHSPLTPSTRPSDYSARAWTLN